MPDPRSNTVVARRTILGALATTSIASCHSPEPTTWPRLPGTGNPFDDPSATPRTYAESPMLTERVEAGELPPVAERLPSVPYVVRPEMLVTGEDFGMRQGTYGGILQLAQQEPDFDPVIFVGNVEPLLWAPGGFSFDAGVEGNVVANFEVRNDDTEFIFSMREGLKWSDGVPVTVEDVEFAYNDVLLNEEITPAFPSYLRSGRDNNAPPAELLIIDESTFGLRFAAPYGSFISQIAIANWTSYADLIKPKHYLAQFHREYASGDELREHMRAESVPQGQWWTLFRAVQLQATTGGVTVTSEKSIGHPTLTPWHMVEASTGVYHYERNPYYFKVDPQGNQLPYIDRLRSQAVQDQATLTARALMGEFDYGGERGSLRQLPLIAAQERRGELDLSIPRKHVAPITFFLNLTYEDEVWREVTRDVRFRRALSLALNRQEIIDNFFLGEFADLPSELNPPDHDVAESERILDELGMDERDSQGFRLGPDGERFTIPFEIGDLAEDFIPMSQLVAEYFQRVGIHTTVRQLDLGVHGDRLLTNALRASALWVHHDIWNSAGWDDYLPTNQYGPLWQDWFTSHGERGEEPPEQVQDLFEYHRQLVSAAPGTDTSRAAYQAIVDNHHEHIWTLVPVERAYYPTFFSPRVANVPRGTPDDTFGIVYSMSMEQWYVDEG